jgi:hypothetical protein
MDNTIELFKSGVQNLLNDEVIPQDAAQDSLGFITQDGKIKLIGGRALIGTDSGTRGVMRGLWIGYTVSGAQVIYRKTETKLQYFNTATQAWTDILTNLTSGTEASFANYSSLAGAFTFFVTTDGYWKINNAFPQNPVNMYVSTKNFHGRMFIDNGRTILWDRNDSGNRDRTGLYGSHIDPQGSNYQTVTNEQEATGNGSTKAYTGNLAFKALDALAMCFGLQVTAPTGSATNISAITRAVNAQITSASHGLSQGDTAVIAGLSDPTAGTGTITASTNFAITGSGTAFTTQLKAGCRIYATATRIVGGASVPVTLIVASIADDTHLTLQFPFDSSDLTLSGVSFNFSNMTQIVNIPLKVVSVIDANNVTVNLDTTNFDVYTSGGTLTKAETLLDQQDGTLTATSGATGTINYVTGAYTFNFKNNVVNNGVVLASYQYEDSNNGGVTDFTHSAERLAGEGFVVPQDKGGDPIMNVLIGQDGAYYSLKQQRAYQFALDDTDLNPTNIIYYENMGIPSLNSGVSTQKGIVFLNTSNPDKPEMTILQKNLVSATLIPAVLFPGFKFANYDYSDAYFDTYERYITVSCKKIGSDHNDTILLCNLSDGTVDVSPYEARMFAKDNAANLYIGSPLQENVYQIYSGFDDLGNPIENYWIGSGDAYGSLKLRAMRWRFIREELKKFRKYKIKGLIALDQVVDVYFSYDEAPFELVGTIRGRGTYVDSGAGTEIGTNVIGQQIIGGQELVTVYPYFCELKVRPPKFRKRAVRFVATGIGYFDISFLSDFDIMLFENRVPSRFRSKQNVSIDGTQTDQPDE